MADLQRPSSSFSGQTSLVPTRQKLKATDYTLFVDGQGTRLLAKHFLLGNIYFCLGKRVVIGVVDYRS